MAVFKYRMENILRIKERLEEQKRLILGQAMMRLQKVKDEQQALQGHLDLHLAEFYEKKRGRTNAMDLKRMSEHVAYYERQIKEHQKVVDAAVKEVSEKRQALKEALEERKIQEKLKERALERYLEEEKLKEQQLLDEVVGYRYAQEERE